MTPRSTTRRQPSGLPAGRTLDGYIQGRYAPRDAAELALVNALIRERDAQQAHAARTRNVGIACQITRASTGLSADVVTAAARRLDQLGFGRQDR